MGKGASILLFFAVAALVTVGVVMLASASAKWDSSDEQYLYLWKQVTWLGAGLVGMFAMSMTDYRFLKRFAPSMFVVTCVALILCYVPGIGAASHGESRWINLPVIGRFQPSEPAKLAIMVSLAAWFARYQAEIGSLWRGFVIPSLLLGVPLMLILFEWDMGTAAGLGAAGLIVLFVTGTRWFYLLPTVAIGAALFAFMVSQSPNRMNRLKVFQDPFAHMEGAGRQQALAIEAFGNGGPTGVGLGNGVVKQMNFPEHHTDFIFPIVGEELGVWVAMAMILCFVVIMLVGMGISLTTPDLFGRTLGIGITCSIVIPAMMNIGVTTASLPNTGLPLPFVSYGGSSLVFTLIMVGVLFSILRQTTAVDPTEIPKIKEKIFEVKL